MNGLYKFFRRNSPVVVPVNDEHQLQISDQMEVPPYYVELNDNPRTEEESENEDTDKGWCNMC